MGIKQCKFNNSHTILIDRMRKSYNLTLEFEYISTTDFLGTILVQLTVQFLFAIGMIRFSKTAIIFKWYFACKDLFGRSDTLNLFVNVYKLYTL